MYSLVAYFDPKRRCECDRGTKIENVYRCDECYYWEPYYPDRRSEYGTCKIHNCLKDRDDYCSRSRKKEMTRDEELAKKIAIAISTTIASKHGTKHWCEDLWGITEEDLRDFLDFGVAAMTGYRQGKRKCGD